MQHPQLCLATTKLFNIDDSVRELKALGVRLNRMCETTHHPYLHLLLTIH